MVGLADPGSNVAALYGQEVNLLKMGRMPAMLVVDAEGLIRYAHYAENMKDYPDNSEVLGVIRGL